ncbi:MAG: hydroxymethylglutaryl-CoA reductase, degradative [Candidatus Micrarchaeota archaeon]|nr:hydroxymethylglutaryl-CoA reductase, degradative [Candidatus Micrarchaeota archaeon]
MDVKKTSAISGFYKLSRQERIEKISKACALEKEQAKILQSDSPLEFGIADRMVENALGMHGLPFAVATNFIVNGREVLVPMAIEEPSVVAAASNGAKLCRESNGFEAGADEPVMVGQVQLVDIADAKKAAKELNAKKSEIMKDTEPFAEGMARYGGGLRGFSARALPTQRGEMVIAEFEVDVRDAMGANTINTVLEGIAPKLEELTGGKVRLRILTNLAIKRMARSKAIWKKEAIGAEAIEGVLDAWAFAEADVFRACTHNKGIMNGIDAVAVATGNDWRAVEAGAHAFAAAGGKYRSLTRYRKLPNGDLEGEIELPLAVGTIGGAIKTLPTAQVALSILGVKTARELACVMASVGLAQNFAALKALSTEGIQRGHMELHAKNLAISAGASGAEIEKVAGRMAEERNATASRAEEILHEIRKK